jgi:hypothetical protein
VLISLFSGEPPMVTIRLPKTNWAKAWRAMIEIAPVRLIADDPVYEVLPAHLGLLTERGFTYQIARRILEAEEAEALHDRLERGKHALYRQRICVRGAVSRDAR